jgi:MoaA/NifB/PqqE/SkfB family radical SAM enzyme
MLDYAVRNSGVFVTITTNGTILNEKRITKLLASGLHLIDISIDAFKDETYAAVRINGNLGVTRTNVLRLLDIRRETNSSSRIVVSFVEQPQNVQEAADFERYWKDHGVDYVVIRRLHSAAGGVTSIAKAMRDEHTSESRYPCLYPWERILLNPRGELAFCPQDWTHGSAMVNYRDTTIRELWQSDAYRLLRNAHLKNNFCDHRFCGQCPDWKTTRWPGEGRSYADMVGEFNSEQTL